MRQASVQGAGVREDKDVVLFGKGRNILKESISYPKEMSEDAKDFIQGNATRKTIGLLMKNPKKRSTVKEAMNHRWLKEN